MSKDAGMLQKHKNAFNSTLGDQNPLPEKDNALVDRVLSST